MTTSTLNPHRVIPAKASHKTRRVATWNARRPASKAKGETYTRTGADVIEFLLVFLREWQVDVLCLQEVAAYHDALATVAKRAGYALLVFDDPGHGDNAIMVRNGVEHGHGYDVDAAPSSYWLTPTGAKSYGRAPVVAWVDGVGLVLCVHRPPSIRWPSLRTLAKGPVGPIRRIATSKAQALQEVVILRGWFKRHPTGGALVAGDHNAPATAVGDGTPSGVAKLTGLTVQAGSRIDYAMTRGLAVERVIVLPAKTPESGRTATSDGSDHDLVVYDVRRVA